ncbi:unnamed protein product [Symbiodinium sp. CCMP2592]|nr:unnamed protein product [Symbiodinium sp. CCMP2592]
MPTASMRASLSSVRAGSAHSYCRGNTGNLLLPRTDRSRRHLAAFVGTPPGAPILEPCPVPFLVDEWLHGPLLHARLAATLGFPAGVFSVSAIRGVLPGLPSEQLLLTPATCSWRQVWLPVDLRPLGGRICMLMCPRDSTCRAIAVLALAAQTLQTEVDLLLAKCSWGWLTLMSQPLLLQDVDTLQFQIGPAADALQGPVGSSLDPPLSLFSAMQVSLPTAPSAHEAFPGHSHNQAVLITPNGLVYVEAPVFADAATFRRIVLTSSVPIVVMFFPHVFRQDSSSSSEDQVGGWDTPGTSDTISALQHTLLPSPARASTSTALPACTGVTPSEFLNTSPPSAREPAAEPDSASSSAVSQLSGTRGILLTACVLRGLHHDIGGLLAWGACLVISCGMPGNAVQMHSAPATPRDVVVSASRAPDRQVAAPAGAHTHLQARWLQVGDFGDGPLWSALPSASEVFLITCRLWWPGSSVRLEFSNTDSARDAAAELYRQAIRLGRPQIDYSADHVIAAAQTAAASADVQILRGTAHRLRQGDVVRVLVSAEARTLDFSAFVLPHHAGTASRWLQEGRIVSLLHPVAGVLSFEVPRACDLDASVLGALLRSVTPGQHVFVELPGADLLPHAAFVAAFPGQDCVTYRLTDASDPSAVGLHLAFSGVFESFPAFLESLLRSNRPAAALLRRLQPFGLSVLTWECTSFPGRADCRYWHVHVQADFARAREHLLSISWEPRLVRTPPPLPPPRTRVFHSIGSQTNAPFISASTPAAVLQAPPSICGAGVTPDSASELVDLWCDAWHVKCLVACLPGFTVWALREGSRLYGMCTPAPSWEAVAQALSLSLWELPQTFLSSDSRVWPFPRDLTGVAMQCVSVGYDSPEGVSQLVRNCEADA